MSRLSRENLGRVLASLFLTLALMIGLVRYFLPPGWEVRPVSMACVFFGLFSLLLGLSARLSRPRLILERQTGRELMRRPAPSLYWIRAEYWGAIFLGVAILTWSIEP